MARVQFKSHSPKYAFGTRIKELREKRGWHQTDFVKEFNAKYGDILTIDTLRNWEQHYTIPEIDTLYSLCDFFNCDLDFLLGRISNTTHNEKWIKETLGLDPRAQKHIMYEHNRCDMHLENKMQTINEILGDDSFWDVIALIEEAKRCLRNEYEQKEYRYKSKCFDVTDNNYINKAHALRVVKKIQDLDLDYSHYYRVYLFDVGNKFNSFVSNHINNDAEIKYRRTRLYKLIEEIANNYHFDSIDLDDLRNKYFEKH